MKSGLWQYSPPNPEFITFFKPVSSRISLCFTCVVAFVHMSALCSLLQTWVTLTSPFSTHTLINWNRVSMYLLRPWNTRFFMRSNANLLSMWLLVVGLSLQEDDISISLGRFPWSQLWTPLRMRIGLHTIGSEMPMWQDSRWFRMPYHHVLLLSFTSIAKSMLE